MISSSATPRADLNIVVTTHVAAASGFVLPRVLPTMGVPKTEGRFWKVQPGSLAKAPTTVRAPGATYARDNLDLTTDTYATVGKGLEGLIPDEQSRQYGDTIRLEQARAVQKVNQILRREEVDLAATLFNTSTWALSGNTGLGVTNEWDDHANATPAKDIVAGKNGIRARVGDWTEMGMQLCLLLPWNVRRNVELCTSIRTGLGGAYTDPAFKNANIPDALLAAALGVDEIITAGNMYKSSGTDASPTLSDIWSDEYAMLFVRAVPNQPEVMGLGLTFVWNEFGGEYEVKTYREEGRSSGVVQVNRHSQQKVTDSNFAFLLGNVSEN